MEMTDFAVSRFDVERFEMRTDEMIIFVAPQLADAGCHVTRFSKRHDVRPK
jgi:hypothetical protein